MFQIIVNLILKNVFIVSKQPVLFKDLLEANALFNEGMLVDPAKLNFRFRYARVYFVYTILCLILLAPMLLITHEIFTKFDFHISIIGSIIVTSFIFICFDIFKIWTRKLISQRLIKDAWKVHFPYFPYEKYSQNIEIIYNNATKNEIQRKDLEKFVLEQLVVSISN